MVYCLLCDHTSSYWLRGVLFVCFPQSVPNCVILWAESSTCNYHLFLYSTRALIHGLTKLNSVPKAQKHCWPTAVGPRAPKLLKCYEMSTHSHLLLPKCSPGPALPSGIWPAPVSAKTLQKRIFLLQKKLVSDIKYMLLVSCTC